MWDNLSARQKEVACKLHPNAISPELKLIREFAQRITFDSVRCNDGYHATESDLALGYFAFFLWLMTALDEDESEDHLLQPSVSIRNHALSLIHAISSQPEVISSLKELTPAFDPGTEYALGSAKSTSQVWMESLSRGVVVSARMMGFSFCNHTRVLALAPVAPDFGEAFCSLSPQQQINASREWLDVIMGEAAKRLRA